MGALRTVAAALGLAALLLGAPDARATVRPDGGPAPSFLKNVDGRLFFATYETDGWRLWTSDATDAGTIPLASGLGLDVELVAVERTLVFSTRGALWKSDGTPAGTVEIVDLPFYPNGIKAVKQGVYFSDGRGQLWKSDLTAAGTVLVKDVPPGYVFHDLTPAAITSVLARVFFRAVDHAHGNELWVTNGTPEGTHALDLNPLGGSAPGHMTYFDGTLLFAADGGADGYELWRSDGTPEGTRQVKDINTTGDAFPMNLRSAGDVVLFSADDGTSGAELWKTDGTEDGTVRVADLNAAGGSFPNAFLNVGGTMYFRADDGTSGVELWKSDGTPEGTARVADLNPAGSSVPAGLHQIAGRLFFTADDGIHGEELWTSDGTSDGSMMVADLNPVGGSQPHYLMVVAGRLWFAADDGRAGTQLWTLDCAAGGWPCTPRTIALPSSPRSPWGVPFLVKDVNPGPGDGDPYYLAAVGRRLFFQAYRPDTGNELWTSDGTEAGTVLVRDLNPGPADSHPYGFVDVGGTAFFLAESSAYGSGIWKTDGTEGGTTLVHDADTGYGWFYPAELTAFDGRLYYFAGGAAGQGLWRTDGTPGGAELVVPGVGIHEMEVAFGVLFFIAADPVNGRPALWRSDGTAAGTMPVRNVYDEGVSGQLVAASSLLFLRSEGALWRSDGTVDGTFPLPGASPKDITAVGDRVFFSARTFDTEWRGRELWTSDGTVDGTALVADVNPGPGDGLPGRLTNVNGTLFFWATDGQSGFELWKSDGTAPGTLLVRDIDPTDVTVPSYFQAIGDLLYFTAHNPSFGYELWRSDGTRDGTGIVRNINLVRSSYPESPANVAGTLFFYADDGRFGDELWALTPCGNGAVDPAEECDDGNVLSGDGCSELCRVELIERCDNCVDDDADGLIDLQDPTCCISAASLAMEKLHVGRRGGKRALRLAGALEGIDLGVPPTPQDVALQLHAGAADPYCARVPAGLLRAGGKTLRFDEAKGTVASANGISRLRIRRKKSGTLRLTAAGRPIPLDVASGEVNVLVGIGPGIATGCASATVRAGRGTR